MSDADKPVLMLDIDGAQVPFVHPDDMTNVQVDWVERQCGGQIDDAMNEGRAALTVALCSIAVCNADPKRDPDEVAKELWKLPRKALGFVQPTVADEAGPTEPEATPDEPAKKPAAKRRTSSKSEPAGTPA